MAEEAELTEEEIELLAEAHIAWETGEPERAGQLIDAYVARHPDRRPMLTTAQTSARKDSPFETMECLRCKAPMPYGGRLHLRSGKVSWGFWLGDLGEVLGGRSAFDVYRCPACGHMEFFAPDATKRAGPLG